MIGHIERKIFFTRHENRNENKKKEFDKKINYVI